MKEKRSFLIAAVLFLILGCGLVMPQMSAQAASVTNVTKAPKAKKGKIVKTSSGIRYQYTDDKTFAKNEWLKISNKIYYFNSKGYAQKKWKTYRSRRYYFDQNGCLVTGWKTLTSGKYYFWKSGGDKAGSVATGKVKIGKDYYYFSAKGVMLKGWRLVKGDYYYFSPTTGKMAVNKMIGDYKVDKNGKRMEKITEFTDANGKVDYWVGDSRTLGLANAKNICSQCIAKVGAGYSWYVSSAEAVLMKKLKKNPDATVIINFGVNDIGNISKYITRYKKLIKAYPKAKIYFLSVNPIDSKYTAGYVSNSQIKAFNKKLKAAFPQQYIDSNTYISSKGFKTVDGLHYTTSTYKCIYNYVLTKV